MNFSDTSNLVVRASVCTPLCRDVIAPKSSDSVGKCLMGNEYYQCQVLLDEFGVEGIYFVLNELSIRFRGVYRIKVQLLDANK